MNTNIWEPLNKKGLHFLHININSLLRKVYELKCNSSKTKAAIIGITESKLNHTVPDIEGVACYSGKDLCFNTKTLNCKEIENTIFDLLLPKSKQVTIGVFYRPPNF